VSTARHKPHQLWGLPRLVVPPRPAPQERDTLAAQLAAATEAAMHEAASAQAAVAGLRAERTDLQEQVGPAERWP
jgi:hypothetical protein